MKGAWIIAAASLLLPWPGLAQGRLVESAARIADKQVPLPPGQWIVAAEGTEGQGRDAVAAQVLARVAGGAVDALIVARANTTPRTVIYGPTEECDRPDVFLAYVVHDTAYDGLCAFLNLVVLSPQTEGPPVWVAARDALRSRGLSLSSTWLKAGFRARTVEDVLDVRYYFRPPQDADGGDTSWAGSSWSPERVAKDAARSATVERLAAWAAWTRESVQDGIRGRVKAEGLPPNPWDVADIMRSLIDQRIKALDALRAQGAIDEARYAAQLAQLAVVATEPERAEMSMYRKAFWKTLTYRVASFLDGVAVSYVLLGSLVQTAGFTVSSLILRPPTQYLHEIAWERSGVGRPASIQRPREFEEIGMVR